MSYRMKDNIASCSTVPVKQSSISEYNLIRQINITKDILHKAYLEVEDLERKIDFIESRLNSKVPITEERKLELEIRLVELHNNFNSSDKHKHALENQLNDFKRSLIDIQNILY